MTLGQEGKQMDVSMSVDGKGVVLTMENDEFNDLVEVVLSGQSRYSEKWFAVLGDVRMEEYWGRKIKASERVYGCFQRFWEVLNG